MRTVFYLGPILFAVAAPAAAQDAPTYAPAPDWVANIAPAETDETQSDKPIQVLLVDQQIRIDGNSSTIYVESVSRAQNPQGLAALGNIAIGWQPDRTELVIHKLHLIRDGEVTDLLEKGQEFVVLRRENNLENAVLDGALTAAIQPEGLETGDEIDLAYSLRSRPYVIDFKPENLAYLAGEIDIGRLYYRFSWPSDQHVEWRASEAMGEPSIERDGANSVLVLDRSNVEGPEIPENAPLRYALPATLQLSGYRDWSELSAVLAPSYVEARQLELDSPLRAEIDRIAAANTDEKSRAMAALRLAQDQVRYVALAMGDGGYVPASADRTWQRRFGDCKGKTSLLLALLDGLGIEAEPVLVGSIFGAIIDDYLPQVSLFDHVLVRARIAGRDFWLDGTRSGDRVLDDLTSTNFGWGLPIARGGRELIELPRHAPDRPLYDTAITIDATGGIEDTAPVTAEIAFRGDAAAPMRAAIGQIGRQQVLDLMRNNVTALPEDSDIETIELEENAPDGSLVFTVNGTMPIAWARIGSTDRRQLRFDEDAIVWDPDFERDDEAFADIPFALEFPVYVRTTQTVLLPDNGRGYSIDGGDIDQTIAGTRLSRRLSLSGGRAVAVTEFRRLSPEISAEEARSSIDILDDIEDDHAYLLGPPGSESPRASAAKSSTASPRPPMNSSRAAICGCAPAPSCRQSRTSTRPSVLTPIRQSPEPTERFCSSSRTISKEPKPKSTKRCGSSQAILSCIRQGACSSWRCSNRPGR